MPEITVLCTFYDAVNYLPLTVRSILDSTFTDFELLLVDDGGPYQCGKLCDILAETDSRVRVIHKSNGGLASAINAGVREAKGRYLTVVDSDDLIAPNKLEFLYNAIQQSGCPMAACAADCIDEAGQPIVGEVVCSLSGNLDALELFRDAFSTGSCYGPLLWNKLFDIQLWREKDLLLDEKTRCGGYVGQLHKLFEGETIFCSNEKLHHHRIRPGSLTAKFGPQTLEQLTTLRDWVTYFSAKADYGEIYQFALARYWQTFYDLYRQASRIGMPPKMRESFAPRLKDLRQLKPVLLACPKLIDAEKFRLRLFCIHPSLTCKLALAREISHGKG